MLREDSHSPLSSSWSPRMARVTPESPLGGCLRRGQEGAVSFVGLVRPVQGRSSGLVLGDHIVPKLVLLLTQTCEESDFVVSVGMFVPRSGFRAT